MRTWLPVLRHARGRRLHLDTGMVMLASNLLSGFCCRCCFDELSNVHLLEQSWVKMRYKNSVIRVMCIGARCS